MNKHKKLYATITVLAFAVLVLAALAVQNQIALKKTKQTKDWKNSCLKKWTVV